MLLIPISDPKKYRSFSLQIAARCGHTECVELLIPVSISKANKSLALQDAVQGCYYDCAKLLLPVSNPKENESRALYLAALTDDNALIALLIPVSDYKQVLKHLLKHNKNTDLFQQCINEYEVNKQREKLLDKIQKTMNCKKTTVKRKI